MKGQGPAFVPTMLFELGAEPDRQSVEWVRRHPLIRETLGDFKGRKRGHRLEAVIQLLALYRFLTQHGAGTVGADLKRQVVRAAKGLMASGDLLQSPASLLAPRERLALRTALVLAVDALAVFLNLSSRGNWKDLIRAQITTELQTGPRRHNDRAVGELVGIIEGSEPFGRRSNRRRRSAEAKRIDEGVWRRRLEAAQRQWRLRHTELMAEVQSSRRKAALKALSELAEESDMREQAWKNPAPRVKKIAH